MVTFLELTVLIGTNFRLIREDKGISQEFVADKLDIGRARVSEFENGKGNPTLKTISNFAEAIEIDLIDMFDFERLRNNIDVTEKQTLINIHCSTLQKRNLNEIQHIFDSTNAFLNFIDKR